MGWIGVAAVLSFATCAMTSLPNIAGQRLEVHDSAAPADAIVVLGAGMMGDGSLNDQSMRRLMHGLLLYKEGFSPLIIFTGPREHGHFSESEVRANIAEKLGLPEEAIIAGIEVDTTRDEAQRVAAILHERHMNHVLLITESLHTRRAKAVFEKAGLSVTASPSDELPDIAGSPMERLMLTIRVFSESAALTYYKLAGFI